MLKCETRAKKVFFPFIPFPSTWVKNGIRMNKCLHIGTKIAISVQHLQWSNEGDLHCKEWTVDISLNNNNNNIIEIEPGELVNKRNFPIKYVNLTLYCE